MQRKLNPQAQVEAVDAFVRAAGSTPKRAEVLELVARLNGAANWNELERPPRESAFSRKMRELLLPWSKRFDVEKQMREFTPAPIPSNEAVLQAIHQLLLPPVKNLNERETATRACMQLQMLSEVAEEVATALRKRLGEDREVPPGDVPLWSLQTRMMDGEIEWTILSDGAYLGIPEDLLEEAIDVGVAAEARIDYPRGDRYGVPEEATDPGCREWLWAQGFALSTEFDVFGKDTGDDSMMVCHLAVHLPQELVDRIRDAAEQS